MQVKKMNSQENIEMVNAGENSCNYQDNPDVNQVLIKSEFPNDNIFRISNTLHEATQFGISPESYVSCIKVEPKDDGLNDEVVDKRVENLGYVAYESRSHSPVSYPSDERKQLSRLPKNNMACIKVEPKGKSKDGIDDHTEDSYNVIMNCSDDYIEHVTPDIKDEEFTPYPGPHMNHTSIAQREYVAYVDMKVEINEMVCSSEGNLCNDFFIKTEPSERITTDDSNEESENCNQNSNDVLSNTGQPEFTMHQIVKLPDWFQNPSNSLDECGKSFKIEHSLTERPSVHSDKKPYSCDKCRKTFITPSKLVEHNKMHSNIRPYSCDHCNKSFKRRQNLVEHVFVHSEEKPHGCKECGKRFKRKSHLKEHMLCVHLRTQTFTCHVCGKSVQHKRNLIEHLLVSHPVEKPHYACDQCGKKFIAQNNLSYHHRTVHATEVRPYSCSDCGKSFRKQWELTHHSVTHLEDKPHSCLDCGKSFKRHYELQVHCSVIHSEERPHSCLDCGKSFKRRSYLTKHRITHSEERPHSCSDCGKTFKRHEDLVRHCKTH